MRFYDKPGGPSLAVSEWRSVLQTSSPSLSMPLLYVANEVLQTSKRNRGSKFLEAFSPVLGSSLMFIVGRDRSVVEKVRRTVKVWGDRHVFSMRFVMDLLAGLESYREGGSGRAPPAMEQSVPAPSAAAASAAIGSPKPSLTASSENDDDDDDDEDMFGGSTDGQKLLDISIDVTALSDAKLSSSSPSGSKRRRTSNLTSSATAPSNVAKKPKALSGQNFLKLFQSIANLDEKYKSSMGVIEAIPPSYLDDDNADIDDLVGDELTSMYKKVRDTQRKVLRERRSMYSVALQRRELEKEAKRYISWLKNLAKVDDDDIKFVDKLEEKLEVISVCHGKSFYCSTIHLCFLLHRLGHLTHQHFHSFFAINSTEEAKKLRDVRRSEEAQQLAEAEAIAQQEAEEKERKSLLEDVKKEAEAKPGMIWNPNLREYQYLHDHTEESWRD